MRTTLVTGANRGIGLALVKTLLSRGDKVIATSRDPGGAIELTKLASGSSLTVLPLAVTDAASVAAFATAVETLVGSKGLDVLINNAGIIGPRIGTAAEPMDFEAFAETLAVNTLGPLRVTQALLPLLRRAKGAKVLTISSAMGSMSHSRSDRIAYRASKAAVNKVMQGLASDLAAEGIAVAVAHPGWVRTDMGGSGADISPDESARGLSGVIDALKPNPAGAFFNWSGEALPW
ncbi:MAG: SDR family oxidoreductase [Alphaproteobacteria bacterium]